MRKQADLAIVAIPVIANVVHVIERNTSNMIMFNSRIALFLCNAEMCILSREG